MASRAARHRFDPVSFVLGVMAVTAGLIVLGGGSLLDDATVLFPAGLIALGVAILLQVAARREEPPAPVTVPSPPTAVAGQTLSGADLYDLLVPDPTEEFLAELAEREHSARPSGGEHAVVETDPAPGLAPAADPTEAATAGSEPSADPIEPAAAEPEPTDDPAELAVDLTEPATDAVEPSDPAEPAAAEPEPADDPAEPAAAEPEPADDRAEPAAAEPEPADDPAEPAAGLTEPAAAEPEPSGATEPAAELAEPSANPQDSDRDTGS